MKIIVAGDFCPNGRVAPILEKNEFESVLGEVKTLISSEFDYSVVNFESPVVEHPAEPIKKCGPSLKSSEKAVKALKWVGFNCLTLANNHFYDYGEVGVDDSISAIEKMGLDHVGAGKNLLEASMPLYKEIGGKILAIVNCCEHEFSIATDRTGGSNPLNPIRQYYAIREAKEKADFVLVIVHGGFEHYQLPSVRMQETYRFFITIGADAVVNHHQHCFSGYEIFQNKPIFYGLGNFCFDWNEERHGKWNEGYMVSINFSDKISFEIIPYIQCDDEASVKILHKNNDFYNKLIELNDIISDESKLAKANDIYLKDNIDNYIFMFDNFYNRFTKRLYERGLMPSFIKRRRYALIDFLTCESHVEKVVMTIREAFK